MASASEKSRTERFKENALESLKALPLSPEHLAQLHTSAIPDEVIKERGYNTVTESNLSNLERIGYKNGAARTGLLTFERFTWDGKVIHETPLLRPDSPRKVQGKVAKYERPKGSHNHIDVPARCAPKLADAGEPLWITEGVKKADAGAAASLTIISVPGVWNFGEREDNDKDKPFDLKPELAAIPLKGRDVNIVFDSDVTTKKEVQGALTVLSRLLRERGAQVHIIKLPAGPNGEKVGLDDYLAAGHTPDELKALVIAEPQPVDHPYSSDAAGTYIDRVVKDEETGKFKIEQIRIANFECKVLEENCLDDGVEKFIELKVETRKGNRTQQAPIPAPEFSRMDWVIPTFGIDKNIVPRFREHVRSAIQVVSTPIYNNIYAQSGFRKINGVYRYLHGGARDVRLPSHVAPLFCLPPALTGAALKGAINASLAVLDIGPLRVTAPMYCAIWRALLGPVNWTFGLIGRTGGFKTAAMVLCLQHYGAGFTAENLPGNWNSTANYLGDLAFTMKDSLLVFDDLKFGVAARVPGAFDASSLLRSIADGIGRGRMRADGTLRPMRSPRGLVGWTGEENPGGDSLAGRHLVVEVRATDISKVKLTEAQANAHQFSLVMSSYTEWLGSRLDEVQGRMPAEHAALRIRAAQADLHRRTPGQIADLAFAFNTFLQFTQEVGALTESQAAEYRDRVWLALQQTSQEQVLHQREAKPEIMFIERIPSACSTDSAYITNVAGCVPTDQERMCGWKWMPDSPPPPLPELPTGHWEPRGKKIGWINGPDLYLDKLASYQAVQAMVSYSDAIPIAVTTLPKRLNQAHLLASVGGEARGGALEIKKTLEGSIKTVLHLRTKDVFGDPEEI
jgi:hypothetical protein